MSRFELDIEQAKNRSKKRKINFLLSMAGFILLLFSAYIYLTAYQIKVSLKDYKSEVSITTQSGNTVRIGSNRILLRSNSASVVVTARGYESQTLYLEKSRGDNIRHVELEYDYAPVKISSIPKLDKAVWYIDNSIATSNSTLDEALKPGQYNLRLVAKHYEDYTAIIDVDPEAGFNGSAALAPIQVEYNIETQPNGASLYFNEKYIGTSPITGQIDSADIELKAFLEGYKDVNEKIDLSKENTKLVRSYQLASAQDVVVITYKPKGGRLFVDSLEVPASKQISINKIGKTVIRYSHPGYADKTISVSSGESKIEFNLTPQYGNVMVTSNQKSQVFSGNKYLGNTPLERKFLAKTQKIKIMKAGYVPREIEVDVLNNVQQKVNVNLLTWSEHFLKNSAPEITNSVGMQFIRYYAKSFAMGAPRTERGQRANELSRTVDFKRAFYLSKKEVSNAEFSLYKKQVGKAESPVVGISWNDAAMYCNWLSIKEGFEPFYEISGDLVTGYMASSRGYRMPSEAEWEYVAKFANRRRPTIFVWGNDYDAGKAVGNIADKSSKDSVKTYLADYNDGFKSIAPTGSFAAEASGVFDMSGNVSEWVNDVYSLQIPNPKKIYIDFLGPLNGSDHVIKGSNYSSSTWTELRASFKESSDIGRTDVGFRIARYIN
ncbi:MAG: SUMF1/EgtB/PvdO family nonheme iron enzyme [Gammaproteobacteria bacterium]|nr:SUMF1/EgtB/PvdO family nonheme iron enzyme [Gammaproteobacteria bacterium]